MNKEQLIKGLRLMVLIAGAKDAKKAVEILNKKNYVVQYMCHGEGTATNDILDYLGLGSEDKVIIFALVPKTCIEKLFLVLEHQLQLKAKGKGIAFSMPVSGASLFLLKISDEEALERLRLGETKIEEEMKKMPNPITHSLLMAIINQGYSEDVMKVAKVAGATGGTVINARHAGSTEPMKRFGICIQEEKEIVFILTKKENKIPIMKAIGETCGVKSEAQGMVIAVPVDAVAGLNNEEFLDF